MQEKRFKTFAWKVWKNIEGKGRLCLLLHLHLEICPNSLPNDKILDWSTLKALADAKIDVAEMIISLYDRVENIMGKGENAGYQHFLLFPHFFQRPSFTGSLKIRIVW